MNYANAIALFTMVTAGYGTIRRASQYYVDGSGNEYLPGLEWTAIVKELADLSMGLPGEERINVTIDISKDDSAGDTSLYTVIKNEDIRDCIVTYKYYEPEDGEQATYDIAFFGAVDSWSYTTSDKNILELSLSNRIKSVMNQMLPPWTVTADIFDETALDIGAPINLPLGPCERIKCPNVINDFDTDDYAYAVGITGVDTDITKVYRDGVLVDTDDYTIDNGVLFSGYVCIVFERAQKGFDNNYHEITCDVEGFSWDVGGATGLGDSRHLFDAFDALMDQSYDPYGVDLSGTEGLIEVLDDWEGLPATSEEDRWWVALNIGGRQRKLEDWLTMLFAYTPCTPRRQYDGTWTIDVDKAKSGPDFYGGCNDGHYNNIQNFVVFGDSTSQARGKIYYQYGIRSGGANGEDFHYQTELTANTYGVDDTIRALQMKEHAPAKRGLSYVYGVSKYGQTRCRGEMSDEFRTIKPGDAIRIYTDHAADEYRAWTITRVELNRVGPIYFEARTYNGSIYNQQTITAPTSFAEDDTEVTGPATFIGDYVSLGDSTALAYDFDSQSNATYTIAIDLFDSAAAPAKPAASQILLGHRFSVPVVLPAGLKDSGLSGEVAATAETVYDLRKGTTLSGSSSIGSLTVAASGTSATATFTSAVSFNGTTERLFIVAPATQDATFANISFTIVAIKANLT